mmetsp:Transcript_19787/g.32514  ORF Transcript_19787/g.32514 Transcript_19787/m.32514 type:complete len:522 (-) Transcript_19787:1620-3185(-)|eukprot:CAMPEP_0203796762 /NCGR_PEP_ID=MMETSP0100_2-20121128/8162_1 /ASSEMBLY_ACC=CAM_ASM_000210 /TAXON_ID=96639 /ORGANISM=" , Strain NY0313808BC1" /LENGTH=521 /DNA_ID=CAMNT_0050701811 /DNA_START=177 /DNA_END=1742 /DNA_ORIENTATION=+
MSSGKPVGIGYKDVEPWIGLILTSVFLFCCRWMIKDDTRRDGKTKTARLDKDVVDRKLKVGTSAGIGLVFGFIVLAGVLIYIDFPARLQKTNIEVVELKTVARDQCRKFIDNLEYGKAEEIIRDNKRSKELQEEFRRIPRRSLGHALHPFLEPLFFRTGTFCSVLPLFLVLVLDIALRKSKKLVNLQKLMPTESDWVFVLLPTLNAAIAMTWVANMGFHFWLRDRQVTECLIISGHWYTTANTCFAFLFFFIQICFECSDTKEDNPTGPRSWTRPGSTLPYFFGAWFVMYIALIKNILQASQLFHHDSLESVQGIRGMLMVLPFCMIVGSAVLLINIRGAMVEIPLNDACPKEEESVLLLKPQDCCVVLSAFKAESDTELDIAKGDIIRVLSDEMEGWIEVESQEGLIGFVPVTYIAPTDSKRFRPVVKLTKSETVQKQSGAKTTQNEAVEKPIKSKPARPVPVFLQDIQKGRKLSATKPREKETPKSSAPAGGMFAQLQAKLAENRKSISPSDDDDDEFK